MGAELFRDERVVFFRRQPWETVVRVALAALALLVGSAFTAHGVAQYSIDRRLAQTGTITVAEVMSRSFSSSDDGDTTTLHIAFVTKTEHHISATVHKDGKYHGATVRVTYLPSDPQTVRLAGSISVIGDVLGAAVGVVVVALLFVFFVKPMRWRVRRRGKRAPPQRMTMRSSVRSLTYVRARTGWTDKPTAAHPTIAKVYAEDDAEVARVVFVEKRGRRAHNMGRFSRSVGGAAYEVRDAWNKVLMTVVGPVSGEELWVVVTTPAEPRLLISSRESDGLYPVFEEAAPWGAIAKDMTVIRDAEAQVVAQVRKRRMGDEILIEREGTPPRRWLEVVLLACLCTDLELASGEE